MKHRSYAARCRRTGPPRGQTNALVGFVASTPDTIRRLHRLLPDSYALEWGDVLPRLRSGRLDVLVVSTCVIDDTSIPFLQSSRKTRPGLRLIAYCARDCRDHFGRALALVPMDAAVVTVDRELPRAIEHDTGVSPTQALLNRFPTDSETVLAFLQLLDTEPSSRALSIARLAARLGHSRAAFFARLRREGLPTPNRVQLLYKLTAAVEALSAGRSAETAATAAGYSSARALTEALGRVRLSRRKARSMAPSDLFRQWLASMPGQPD